MVAVHTGPEAVGMTATSVPGSVVFKASPRPLHLSLPPTPLPTGLYYPIPQTRKESLNLAPVGEVVSHRATQSLTLGATPLSLRACGLAHSRYTVTDNPLFLCDIPFLFLGSPTSEREITINNTSQNV